MKRSLCFLSILILILAIPAFAHEAGDYRSVNNGNWRILGTWETWDGAAWVAPSVKPRAANNVLIRAGHTVTLAANPDSCLNLVVEAGAVLHSNNGGLRYLHVSGDSVRNDGTLGGATDTMCLQFYGNLRLCGAGSTELSRIRPGAPARTLAVGQDLGLHFAGAALTCNNQDSTSFVIEAGRTLAFGPASFFSLGNSAGTSAAVNARIDIAGTVTLQPGMNFNISVQPGYASRLTLDGGTLNLGDSLVCSVSSTFGSETVTINEGGAINWTSADSMYVDTLVLNTSAGFAPGFPMIVRKLELRKGLYDNSANNLRVRSPGFILRDSGAIAAAPHIYAGGSISVVYTGPQAFTSGPELPEATPVDYTRLRNLTLTDGARLTLTKDILCTENLYLDGGTLSTGAFSMGVKDTAFRYSGHVIGNYYSVFDTLNKIETYPVGTANGYTPVTVALDTVYGEGALMVLVTEGGSPRPDAPQNTLQRWWTLSPYPLAPLAFDTATITLTYLDGDFTTGLTPADEGTMVVGKYDAGWAFPQVTDRDTAGNTVTVGGIASFSEFVIAKDSAAVLPVELTSFTVGAGEGGAVILEWATASERNTLQWIVERSTVVDAGWTEVATLPAAGSDNGTSQYRYVDRGPGTGQDFSYRLMLVNSDGSRQYFGPVRVGIAKPAAYGLSQAFPNPFSDRAAIRYQLKDDGRVSLKVYNTLGQCVRSLVNQDQKADYYRVDWSGRNDTGQKVSAGVYLYRLEVNGFSAMKKAMVLR